MQTQNKMINHRNISQEARDFLLKAVPHQASQGNPHTKEYYKLFAEFMTATHHRYTGDGAMNRFNCAVLDAKRNPTKFKSNSQDDVMRKAL